MGNGASVAQRFVLTPTEPWSPQLVSFNCADTVIDSGSGSDSDVIVVLDSPMLSPLIDSGSGSDSDVIVVLDSPLLSPLTDAVFDFEPASIQSPLSYVPPLSQDLPHYEDWLAEARISSPAVSTPPFTSGHGTPPTPEWELDLRFQRELEMQSFYNGQPFHCHFGSSSFLPQDPR